MSLLSNMEQLLVQIKLGRLVPDWRSHGNVELPWSTSPVVPLVLLPPYAILEGEDGMERTMGGDMEPCRPCRVLRLDDDRLWSVLWLPYNTSLESCNKSREKMWIILYIWTWVQPRAFLPTVPTMFWLIGDSKLPKMWIWEWILCGCNVMDWRYIQGVLNVVEFKVPVVKIMDG